MGIRKIHSSEELWAALEQLGDEQSHYLLERYVPGDIFHVDSIVYRGEIRFAIASGYGRPPMDVAHGGGVFTTRVLERGSAAEQALIALNRQVLAALALESGVSHTEYILGHEDGRLYFLETSARVGGAHIAELVEHATGINLWAEWARVEVAGEEPYAVPQAREDYAGLLVSLARQERPDTSDYQDPEIVWRLDKSHHVGFIVRSPSHARVSELLDSLTARAQQEFGAYAPPRDRPTE
jgi:biotin carboxylase